MAGNKYKVGEVLFKDCGSYCERVEIFKVTVSDYVRGYPSTLYDVVDIYGHVSQVYEYGLTKGFWRGIIRGMRGVMSYVLQ